MVNDFSWHKVSEEEKEEIRHGAKRLLKQFAEKISKIKFAEAHFENNSGSREEGTSWKTDDDFREITLNNAPFVDDGYIVAEKGTWK